MRTFLNPYGAAGFSLASAFAVFEKWSLPEFCWSTWLAGLAFTWGCIVLSCLQIVLTARSRKTAYERHLPFLARLTPGVFLFAMTISALLAGWLAFRLYTYQFAFYGLFLSVFAEMEPVRYFGRNGFINSDFVTPVLHLAERFWPMAAAALLSSGEPLLRTDPWKRLVLPLEKEVVRIHVMIVATPFLALLAWAVFGKAYQPVTVVLLLALFTLLPSRRRTNAPERPDAASGPPS